MNVLSPAAADPRAPKHPDDVQTVELNISRAGIETASTPSCTMQPPPPFLPPAPEDMPLFSRSLFHLMLQFTLPPASCHQLLKTSISFLLIHQFKLLQTTVQGATCLPQLMTSIYFLVLHQLQLLNTTVQGAFSLPQLNSGISFLALYQLPLLLHAVHGV